MVKFFEQSDQKVQDEVMKNLPATIDPKALQNLFQTLFNSRLIKAATPILTAKELQDVFHLAKPVVNSSSLLGKDEKKTAPLIDILALPQALQTLNTKILATTSSAGIAFYNPLLHSL